MTKVTNKRVHCYRISSTPMFQMLDIPKPMQTNAQCALHSYIHKWRIVYYEGYENANPYTSIGSTSVSVVKSIASGTKGAIDKHKITNGTSYLVLPHKKKCFIAPLLFDGASIGHTLPL